MAVWDSRVELAAGRIDYKEFVDIVTSSAPSDGHCNTMGTASTRAHNHQKKCRRVGYW
jgi:dihydroxy-acid dehydratase